MRKSLLIVSAMALMSSSALAADFIPEPQQSQFTWTGLYIGLDGGGIFGNRADYQVVEYPDLKASHDLSGWEYGGNVAARYQITPMFVVGVDVTGLGANITGNQDFDLGPFNLHTDTNIDTIVLAEAEAGVALDRIYAFASGGYAGANVDPSVNLTYMGENCFKANDSQWVNGWTVGGGAKYALTDMFIIGAKYNHIVLEDNQFDFNIEGHNVPVNGDVTIDQVVGTLEIKF